MIESFNESLNRGVKEVIKKDKKVGSSIKTLDLIYGKMKGIINSFNMLFLIRLHS